MASRAASFLLGGLTALSLSATWRPEPRAAVDSLDVRVTALERTAAARPVRPGNLLDRIDRLERAFRARDAAWVRSLPAGSPVQGGVVTSGASRARLHPILGRYLPHTGVDIGAPAGTPIRSTAPGVVASRFNSSTYGLGIDVEHGRGTFTRYAHMQRTAVRVGDVVQRGTVIGFVGSTGRATGPHVHYEVFLRSRRVDPAPFLPDWMVVASAPEGSGDH